MIDQPLDSRAFGDFTIVKGFHMYLHSKYISATKRDKIPTILFVYYSIKQGGWQFDIFKKVYQKDRVNSAKLYKTNKIQHKNKK